ncbi:hypothetical protein AVL55_05065 [Alteromonas macleodii]|uniref:Uncharacterized protein n=1 Tax=Alteromonas macleodii TaxID=28108 RepID=A0A126PX30_ALTMA|nr:hypothetical protein [Alteromonas macleodii]AMJ97586.1 hypothetical protein AVL55_05065 [Alteromonas macleodii]
MFKNIRGPVLVAGRNIANDLTYIYDYLMKSGVKVSLASTKPTRFYKKNNGHSLIELYADVRRLIGAGKHVDIEKALASYLHFSTYIFVTESLLPGFLDLPVLKKLGKQIIFLSTGSDVRYGGLIKTFYGALGHNFVMKPQDYLYNSYASYEMIALQDVYRDRLINKLHTTRVVERYADVFLTSPRSAYFAIKPYYANSVIGDFSTLQYHIPNRDKPLVVHCPSSRGFKQTQVILEVVNDLKSEGYQFSFELIEGVSNEVVIQKLMSADILIDQISPGKSGTLGLEGLATGCCVLGCNNEKSMPIPYRAQPIVGINVNNLKSRLREMIENKQLRYDLASAGVAYTSLDLHSAENFFLQIDRALDRNKVNDYDYYPKFFWEHAQIAKDDLIPEHIFQLTEEIVDNYGIPALKTQRSQMEDVFLSGNAEASIWDTTSLHEYFWGWWNPAARFPHHFADAEKLSNLKEYAQNYAE